MKEVYVYIAGRWRLAYITVNGERIVPALEELQE